MIVDVHAHYYPRRYLERIDRADLPYPGVAPLGAQTIDERLALLDRCGVDVQVLSLSQAQPYLPAAKDAAEAASMGNDLFAELCAEHAGRFYTLAVLPLPFVDESLAEIDRALSLSPVVGFTMGCTIAGRQVDDPQLEPVYAELDRRQAAVLLHPVGQDCLCSDKDYNLAWLCGGTFEDTIAATRLALSGIGDRYPNIKFIVPHLGGTLPFVLARMMRMTKGRGEEAIHRMYFDTVSGSVEALRCAADVMGADHLLYGTDYPYEAEEDFEERLSFFDRSGLDAATTDHIKGGLAVELLGIS